MKDNHSYIGRLIHGITSLLTGMKTTMIVFCRKKTTEQYPENRATLKLSDRFRGTLTMRHNDEMSIGAWLAACARWLAPTIPSR